MLSSWRRISVTPTYRKRLEIRSRPTWAQAKEEERWLHALGAWAWGENLTTYQHDHAATVIHGLLGGQEEPRQHGPSTFAVLVVLDDDQAHGTQPTTRTHTTHAHVVHNPTSYRFFHGLQRYAQGELLHHELVDIDAVEGQGDLGHSSALHAEAAIGPSVHPAALPLTAIACTTISRPSKSA